MDSEVKRRVHLQRRKKYDKQFSSIKETLRRKTKDQSTSAEAVITEW
jgi:hypothetical protein